MTRPIKKSKHNMTRAFGWLLAAGVVGLSGAMSLSFAHRIGAETGNLTMMIVAALVSQGGIAALPAYTFGRGRFVSGLLSLLFVVPCLVFSWGAAYDFARSNFAIAEAARTVDRTEYEAQRDRVAMLRTQMDAVAGADAPEVARQQVDKAVWRRTAGCTDVTIEVSERECKPYTDALTLSRLKTELATALDKLSGMKPAGAAGGDGGPALALARPFAAALGLEIDGWAGLMGIVMMLMSETGAVVAPLALMMAGRERKRGAGALAARIWPQQEVVTAIDARTPPPINSDYCQNAEAEDVSIVKEWFDRRVTIAGDREERGADLYHDYCAYCAEIGESPVRYRYFGTVLTRHLRLSKRKSGTVRYLRVRLKARGQVQPAAEAAA